MNTYQKVPKSKVPLNIISSTDRVPETFKDPVISTAPVIANTPLSVMKRDKLPLSLTSKSDQ